MFVVYDHPTDHPDQIIVRRWEILPGIARATAEFTAHDSLEEARHGLMQRGLTWLPRHPTDEPQILESWI
jgi:hypothetical protein